MGQKKPLSEYLEQISLANKVWESDFSQPTGRICDVFFADLSEEEVTTYRKSVQGVMEEMDKEDRFVSWVLNEFFDDFHEDLDVLEESNGNPIVFVVELPNGQQFGDLFKPPQSTNGVFFDICEALNIDLLQLDNLDSNVFTGKIVPIKRQGVSWQIDTEKITERTRE